MRVSLRRRSWAWPVATPLVAALVAGTCAPAPEVPPPLQSQGTARVAPVVINPPKTAWDGSIRVAAIFPALGRFALSGLQSHNGARLAVEEINGRGGVRGRPLKLAEYRTGSYFVDARAAAERAADAGAVALIGSNSSALSQAIAEIAESRALVQISNVSTANDLTWDPTTGAKHPFVFRVCGTDTLLGRRLAEFARDDLHARRAAVLYEVGRAYSAKLARAFIAPFRDPGGGRTVAEFFYLPLETDFRNLLREVQAFRPDVLFVPGSFTDATLVAIQARRLGLRMTMIGGDAWSNRLLFQRGGPETPAYYVDHCVLSPDFAARYRARFGDDADGCRAVLAYDAVQAVAAGLQAMGPLSDEDLISDLGRTRAALRRAVAAVSLRGEAGSIRFDEHGDARRGVAILEVRADDAGAYAAHPYAVLGGGGR
jgi:branched-chain amino acid transport system substrate-binding protein